jgi:hypothetical protein
VWYDPEAVVEHKVFDYRTKPTWLLERAFWQGYSKRVMKDVLPDEDGGEEGAFLRQLVTVFVPGRCRTLADRRSFRDVSQLLMLLALTCAVGFGYVYAIIGHARQTP